MSQQKQTPNASPGLSELNCNGMIYDSVAYAEAIDPTAALGETHVPSITSVWTVRTLAQAAFC